MKSVLENLLQDLRLNRFSSNEEQFRYFTLDPSHRWAIQEPRIQIGHNFDNHLSSLIKFDEPTVRFNQIYADLCRRIYTCNRGVLIYVGINKTEHCFCPSSYYGDRCQFQNERVSLIVKFTKRCAPDCSGIYIIFLALVDGDQLIHSYDQFTYISTNISTDVTKHIVTHIRTESCDIKYNLYFLYRSRPKDLTKNYSIHIHAYNKTDLSYYASWIVPITFHFLPVNCVAAYLTIPAERIDVVHSCQLDCGVHGYCDMYLNDEKHFCRCDSG
jgi:hypothetical protein